MSGPATDSWNRFDEDVQLMKRLGSNAYRFSVEWSRLEPTPGAWDAEATARYRQWAQALRAQGIGPLVTLYHFTFVPNVTRVDYMWGDRSGFAINSQVTPIGPHGQLRVHGHQPPAAV